MGMKQISIDLEVYKFIEQERESFEETQNQILRRIFFGKSATVEKTKNSKGGGLFVGSTLLKNGLKLRRNYKGRMYEAAIEDNQINFNGKKFSSPSSAAYEITGHNINGWRWWEYYDDQEGEWRLIDTLRKS